MHYYKRHIGDYAKKAGHLSPLEHGVYNLIIDSYYDREKAPTLSEAMRWARARTTEEREAVEAVLSEFFTADGDVFRQKRIDEELDAYHGKAEKNREIAIAREQAKRSRSGHETNTDGARNVHESCTDGLRGSHDSITSGQPNHKPLTINHKPEKKQKRSSDDDAAFFAGVDSQVANDFKAIRKAKRLPLTKTAMDEFMAEVQKAGLDLEGALRICCARGWGGFNAAWLDRDKQPQRGGQPSSASDKFRVNGLDHSSSNAAMAASMEKHGVSVSDVDDPIEF